MGRYSGILLCSDFDGTLAKNQIIPKENLDAIRYFCDNGGVFSVVSGRNVEFLDNYTPELVLRSYVACLNGTEIYHYPTKTLVERALVPEGTQAMLKNLIDELDCISDIRVFGMHGNRVIENNGEDFCDRVMALFSEPVRKLLIHSDKPYADDFVAFIKRYFGDGFEVARSWSQGLEISNGVLNKGIAARKMADLIGADKLVCVGDYENDISLLKAADISFAVGNAIPSLKKIATHTTVNVEECAIAAIIETL